MKLAQKIKMGLKNNFMREISLKNYHHIFSHGADSYFFFDFFVNNLNKIVNLPEVPDSPGM